MTISTVSTAYLNSALLPAVRQTQTQLATLQTESTTGEYADLGLHLAGQSGYEMSLRTQDDLLQTMTTNNTFTGNSLDTAQTALDSLKSSAETTVSSIVAWTSGNSSGTILRDSGQNNLSQLIAQGNASMGGNYVFGGTNSSTAPLNDYFSQTTSTAKTAIDNAFQTYFGFSVSSPQVASITSSQMQSFLTGPFAAQFQGANWTANWSNASSVNTSSQIAPGQTVQTSTNTNTAGFQQLAQGYTMLSEFGAIGLSADTAKTLANTAITVLNSGVASVTDTQSQLGLVQAQITQANDYMSTQMTMLQTTLGNLDGIDPAKVATELTALTTQLQTAYQLTAQISKLNLAQYL